MLQELFQDFAAKYVLAAHGTFITARRLHDDAADLKKEPLLLLRGLGLEISQFEGVPQTELCY